MKCHAEDCDLRHCKKCGRHNFEVGDRCDVCLIQAAYNEMEEVTKGFSGNYEAAAKFMGW